MSVVEKTVHILACDIGGEDGAKRMKIIYDDVEYEVDTCAKHARPVLDFVTRYARVRRDGLGKPELTGIDRLLATSKKHRPKPGA
jgi:hypothetical protein